MRKIFMLFVACLATFSMYGQTILPSSFIEDTYVSVSAGSFGWLQPQNNGYDNFLKSNRGIASLRFGKFINPVVGVEIDGTVGMANRTTFVDHTNVSFNGLVNLNNLFHGYCGKADKVEVVPFVGMGWIHRYDNVANNISAKGGIQFNWNISKNEAWQLNFIPSVTYSLTNNGEYELSDTKFTSNRAYFSAQIGVTYKFKNKKGTHNFVICPNVYTKHEYDDLMLLLAKHIKEKHKIQNQNAELIEHIRAQQHTITTLQNRPTSITTANTAVGFEIGSNEILGTSKANLITLANAIKNENTKIIISGYADSKTGSPQRNLQISKNRANVIKDFLVKEGVDASRIIVVAKGDTEQLFNENDINRVVLIQVK